MKILLIAYDNDSYIHYFPIGLGYISAVLLKEGYQVELYNQDMNHSPDEHLTQYINNNRFDVVGLGFIAGYWQYRKAIKISEAVNKSKNRNEFLYILGGHGPTPEPEYFLKKLNADVIVMGEGEGTIIETLNAFAGTSLRDCHVYGEKKAKDIKGIAYKNNSSNECFINDRRPPIDDIDNIPFPAYHLFPMNYYRLLRQPHSENSDFIMPMLSGRGCPFKCNFCYRMDKGFRARSNESIIEEIKMLKKDFLINYITFGDELLMVSKDRTVSLCEDIIKNELNIKWNCNGRLNYATPEVLGAMKKAGCVFINYGIESMDDQALKNMNKKLTVEEIISGIEATLKAGISPGYNIIFGNIGETKEILQKDVDFLLKYDDGSQMRTIRPVTPYPGSELYYHAIKKGLLKDCEDFYENKHINSDLLSVNFTDIPDDEFHQCLFEANNKLIENYFDKKKIAYNVQMDNLYNQKDVSFRGFRSS